MINVGQVIKLDDEKDYVVLNRMNLHNVNYLFLATIIKPLEIVIVTENNKDGEVVLEEVKDNDELDYILSQFSLNSEEE